MLSTLYSVGITGEDAYVVTADCSAWDRIPKFELLGLPKATADQVKKRIQRACECSGYAFPPLEIVINLTPADIKKESAAFDLAILCAIFQCDGLIPEDYDFSDKCLLGGLSLSGDVLSVSDIMSRIMAAKRSGKREIFVPIDNINEISAIDGIHVFCVKNICQLVKHICGIELIESTTHLNSKL